MSHQKSYLPALAILSTLTAAPSVVYLSTPNVFAQSPSPSPSFPLPSSVKNGTKVQVNGSSSMAKINEALAQRFKNQFAGTDIKIAYDGSDAGLQSVLDGKTDLAAIGRPLTDAEKAKGLVEVPVTRNKIAMIVGKDSPFKGGLTINQFAQIFRGEVSDWSKVGGPAGKIRLVDRPENSDTRRAFQGYPVFKQAPFKTGATAVKLKDDSTDAVVKELGKNGIGYAIADQVADNPQVRVIAMHKVQPTDPRYPFSQPLAYVYKGTSPSPGAQAFLGYATAPQNQQVVEAARVETAKATTANSNSVVTGSGTANNSNQANSGESSSTTATTTTTTTTTGDSNTNTPATAPGSQGDVATAPGSTLGESQQGGFPWWWLLLPLLGLLGLLWWLLKNRGKKNGAAAPAAPIAAKTPIATGLKTPASRVILTPRNHQDAYAYWEVPDSVKRDLKQQGGRQLKLRLKDVTNINIDSQTPHSVKEFDCNDRDRDLHIAIPASNRDYIAELGYVTNKGDWLQVASSEPVKVAARESDRNANLGLAGMAGLAGATAVGADLANNALNNHQENANNYREKEPRVILVPSASDDAYAYWEIPKSRQAEMQRLGGRKLTMRLYDTTGVDLNKQSIHPIQQHECNGNNDLHVPIPQSDRDYVAELGYVTDDGRWLQVGRSEPVRVPSSMPANGATNGSFASTVRDARDNTINFAGNVANTASNFVADTTRNAKDATSQASNWIGDVTTSVGTVLAGGAAAQGVGAVTRTFLDKKGASQNQDGHGHSSAALDQCQIILIPRNSKNAYAYWEVSENYKQAARNQGGRNLMLRIHDATNIDIDRQPPHSTQEFPCDQIERDKHIAIPVSDRDYIAELGYYTADRRWIRIIRSFHVRVPPSH